MDKWEFISSKIVLLVTTIFILYHSTNLATVNNSVVILPGDNSSSSINSEDTSSPKIKFKKVPKIDSNFVILVLSARNNHQSRTAILNTWAKRFRDRVYFLVGNYCHLSLEFRKNHTCEWRNEIEKSISDEKFKQINKTYIQEQLELNLQLKQDKNVIFLENIVDSYRNLILK